MIIKNIHAEISDSAYDLLKEVRQIRKQEGKDFRDKVIVERAITTYCKKEKKKREQK